MREHTVSSAEAVDGLVQAIHKMAVRALASGAYPRVTSPEWRLSVILRRVKALGRNLMRIDDALLAAADSPLSETGLRALEESLWRVDSAREHLIAVCCMTLGVITVIPKKIRKTDAVPKGVEFVPSPKRLGDKLAVLGKRHPLAIELNERLINLAGHRAILMRNQLIHELAPLDAAPELEWVELREVDESKAVLAQASMFIWPEGMSDRKDIRDDTLWSYAVKAVREADAELIHAAELAAELIQSVGQLEYPQVIYRDTKTGEIRLEP